MDADNTHDVNHDVNDDYKRDLPALRVDDRDLPIPVAEAGPRHERASANAHPGWSNLASQRHVRDLAVDPARGDVWLATGGGVLRWWPSLNRFTRYTSEHGLPGNSMCAVAMDGAGQVWAAPEHGGLSYLDSDVWRPYLALDEIRVRCLRLDSARRLWVGAIDGVYAVANPNSGPAVTLPSAGDPLRAIAVTGETGKHDVWLCNARGVHRLQGTRWVCQSEHVQPGILTLARQGESLWLGTMGGLVRFSLASGKVCPAGDWPPGAATALAPVAGGVWATCGGQVGRATEASWTPVAGRRLKTRVTSLAPAGDDGVWVGTHAGLLRGGPNGLRFHLTGTAPDVIGLSTPGRSPPTFNNMIQALAVQQLENRPILLIGTARGLFRLDLHTEYWRRYAQRSLQDVRALLVGADGREVWATSWAGGLHNLKERHVQDLTADVPGPILALAEGPGSKRWAAGLNGLYRGNGQAWALALPASKLPAKGWIQAVAQAQAERVWIGTSAGLLEYGPGTGTLTTASEVLGSADVRSLLVIPSGQSEQLWIGTRRGLYGGQPDDTRPVPGFEGRAVTALAWDEKAQALWAGTDEGLVRVVAADNGNGWEITNKLTARHSGLAADRVTALALSAGESGETILWIGTPCGLSCYRY